MAIFWILATFAGMVGFAWFVMAAVLALLHIGESKAPAIIAACFAMACLGFIVHASHKVDAEFSKAVEFIDRQN